MGEFVSCEKCKYVTEDLNGKHCGCCKHNYSQRYIENFAPITNADRIGHLQKGRDDMAQYCRYCANMVCGDSNYCTVREECFSDEYVKRVNKCKDFDLNEIDALGENERGYIPRKGKEKQDEQCAGQMSLADMERKG